VFVNDVAHERAEFSPDDLSFSTKRRGSAPMQMIFTQYDPFSY